MKFVIAGLAAALLVPVDSFADPPVVLPGSVLRVRADNGFGGARQNDAAAAAGLTADGVTDSEPGTQAVAATLAAYRFERVGTALTIRIQTNHSASAGSVGNFAEGVLPFSLDEPYEYEISGSFTGLSSDAAEAYQQRTFLRQLPPFTATIFLEDETAIGTAPSLLVNEQNNASPGATYTQSGVRTGVLSPGAYEFSYRFESRDLDGAGGNSATGIVTLVLRRPGAPSAPANFIVRADGLSVAFAWDPVPGASSYQLEAGSGPALSNLYIADVGNVTSLHAMGPAGTYTARVRAKSGSSVGPPSNEVSFTLGPGGPCVPPGAPFTLAFTKSGGVLTLTWSVGPGATGYHLQAGTAPGLANTFNAPVGAVNSLQVNLAGVPAGTYFARVIATNACGSLSSNEVTIAVP